MEKYKLKFNSRIIKDYIKNNKLTKTAFGKINALKLRLTESMFSDEELFLTCKLNQGLEIASIVLMSVTAALVITSITLIVLDKKGLLYKKENQENV